MMRIFGFFYRKKQISGRSHASSSKRSVHPANLYAQDVFSVKRAKIKELLGVATPEECWEVDELFNQACWRDPLTDEDANSLDSVVTGEFDLESEGQSEHGAKLQANHRSSAVVPLAVCVGLTAQKLAQHPCKYSPVNHSEERAAHDLLSTDLSAKANFSQPPAKTFHQARPAKLACVNKDKGAFTDISAKADSPQPSTKTFRQARPAKLACVNKDKGACLINRDWPSEQTTPPHPSRIRGKKNASCVESFPLPPPSEKHYLPTPRTRTAEEVSFVAHPLPQPPLTARALEDKGHTSIMRAESCEPPVKPHISAKEYDSIVRAVSCDPPRQLIQKPKESQPSSRVSFLASQQVPQTTPPMALQSQVYGTPQNTPPTTLCQQAQRTSQNTSPTTPISHAHGTPLNTSPTTPRRQALCMPQESSPTTPCTQPLRTPQSTPPSTPRAQLHTQIMGNKTQKMQPPSSPNRQIPRVTLQLKNQPPACEQAHVANSPPCSPLPRSLCPCKWVKGVVLGQGTFGTVHEGFNLEDGSFFAVKVSSKEDISPEIQQEVDVLSKLDHPNIVRYFGCSIVERRLCIFLELVRMGSLDSLLRKYKHFEDHTIRNYTKQILLGLEYLHRKKTIHRDIKSANILVDVNGQVKLSDFGIAKQLGESLASSVKGTPLYMAPEVLTPNEDCYSFPADIWSLGCTVLEMADGKPPWSNLEGFGFLFKVKSGEMPPLPKCLSPEGKDFIRCCLNMLPKDRPTASELLQHPFVMNVVTPEPLFTRSPPLSPLSPMMWPPPSQVGNNTWACGNCCPLSPNQVMTGHQRAQTLVHGR